MHRVGQDRITYIVRQDRVTHRVGQDRIKYIVGQDRETYRVGQDRITYTNGRRALLGGGIQQGSSQQWSQMFVAIDYYDLLRNKKYDILQ